MVPIDSPNFPSPPMQRGAYLLPSKSWGPGRARSCILPFAPRGRGCFPLLFLTRRQVVVLPLSLWAAAAVGPHEPLPLCLCFVLCLQSLQLIPKTRQLFKQHGRDDASHRVAQQAPEPQAYKGTLDPSSMQTAATAPNPGKHKAALITAPAAAC